MKKFVQKYQGKIIDDWGCQNSPEFKQFAKDLRNALKRELKPLNINIESFTIGHYFASGFVERDGSYVYFSYDLNRGFPVDLYARDCHAGILVRTAESAKDYRGGHNNFVYALSMAERIDYLLNLQKIRGKKNV